MTIYKPKPGQGKPTKVVSNPPEVVPEGVPLSDGKRKIEELSAQLVVITRARHRRNMIMLVMLLLVMCVAISCVGAWLFIYRHMKNEPYKGTCGLVYHEGTTSGQIQEEVEIDKVYGAYEKLQVPPVLDSRRTTVVHDFERNLTAIVDRDHGRCFVMKLNRTLVQPPKNFLDLLQKFQSGYYIPDTQVVRQKYRVSVPEIEDLEQFGFYIYAECQFFDTYLLVQDDQLYAKSRKRSVGSKHLDGTYSLGDTLGSYLPLVEIYE